MTPLGLKMKTSRFFFFSVADAAQPKLGRLNKKFAAAALTPVLSRNSRREVTWCISAFLFNKVILSRGGNDSNFDNQFANIIATFDETLRQLVERFRSECR